MELIDYAGQTDQRISEILVRLKGVEDALLAASGTRAETDPSRVPSIIVTGDAPVTFPNLQEPGV